MQKVVFEMDSMPSNCIECTLSTMKVYNGIETWVCPCFNIRFKLDISSGERNIYCPLKICDVK
jgi:hypothetical protein